MQLFTILCAKIVIVNISPKVYI